MEYFLEALAAALIVIVPDCNCRTAVDFGGIAWQHADAFGGGRICLF